MGNEAGKPSELLGSMEPVTNFGINIKQPDKLHLVRFWVIVSTSPPIWNE